MDPQKLQDRVLSQIHDSLPIQNLSGKLTPVALLDYRDRYYLVRCKLKGKEVRCLFLRYDRWTFFIAGAEKIPPEPKRRAYTPVIRGIRKPPDPTLKKKKEKADQLRIKAADKLLAKLQDNIHKIGK